MANLSLDPTVIAWSVPDSELAEALATRPLLVLMHGRGSHERDLFSLLPLLPVGPVIASIRAPLRLGDGFTWFPPAEPGMPSSEAADAASIAVLEWIDSLQTRTPIALFGFSQGAAMAIHLMRHAPERFAAYVALSGFSIDGSQPADSLLETLRPPVFWGRDDADPVIPRSAVARTTAWLPSHSTLTERLYPGIAHSISQEEMREVGVFLAAAGF
jgi:phospholipase/carboxylesterase